MKDFSFITNSHPAYIEGLYQDFVKNPDAIDPEFRRFFEGFDFAVTQGKWERNGARQRPCSGAARTQRLRQWSIRPPPKRLTTTDGVDWKKELGAYRLILGYRNKGHLHRKDQPHPPA